MRIKKHVLPFVTVLVLTAFVAAFNYLWLVINQKPPVDDEAIHLISVLKYLDILKHPSVDMVDRLLHVDILYPPLFPFSAALIATLLGQKNIIIFCMTNVLFLALTFLCMYFIGYKTGKIWSGVLAVCFLMIYPMFFLLSRMFMIEVPLLSMVTLCITFLMYSRNFTNRGMCVAAGVAFGLGLLTKQTFLVFMIGPIMFLFMEDLEAFKTQWKKRIFNLGILIALGACIALPWYVINFKIKISGALNSITNPGLVSLSFPLLSFQSLGYYISMFAMEQAMAFLFIIFVAALWLLRNHLCANGLFIVWIVAGYFVLTLFPNKFCYYTLPYLPAVAWLTAEGFMRVKLTSLRVVVLALVLFFGVYQFVSFSFFSPGKLSPVAQGVSYSPRLDDMMSTEMVDQIIAETREKSITIGMFHLDGNEAFSRNIIIGESGILLNKHMLQYSFDLRGILCEIIDIRSMVRRHDGGFPEFLICPSSLEAIVGPALPKEQYRLIDVFEQADLSKVYLYRFDVESLSATRVNFHKNDLSAVRLPHLYMREIFRRLMYQMSFFHGIFPRTI